MKVTFTEELESKTAIDRKKYCAKCGSRRYCIHHRLQPEPTSWWVECEECGFEGYEGPTRDIALARWR